MRVLQIAEVALFAAILAVSYSLLSADRGIANCAVSLSPVNEGQTVYIVCTFSKPLPSKTTVLVRRSPLWLPSSSEDTVMSCSWDGSFDCDPTQEGYEFVNGNSTELRIMIPSVVKHQEGNYSCQGANYDTNPCSLEVKEIPYEASCSGSSIPNITFFFNKNLRLAGTQFLVTRRPFQSTDVVTIVLDCYGMENNTHQCKQFRGYGFNASSISTTVTLIISSTSKDKEGIYDVLIQSKFPSKSAPCYVRLNDIKDLSTSSTPETTGDPPTRSIQETTEGSTTSSTPVTTVDSQQGILTSILVLLILLILFVISVALYYAWKKKWLPSSIPFRTTQNTNAAENAATEPLNPTHETATADADTQTEPASLQDVGTDCPTDIPLAAAPQEKPVSTHVVVSGESGLEFQPVSAEDKPTKKKHSGKSMFGSRKSKEKKSKEEEQK